jgi:replication factor A1
MLVKVFDVAAVRQTKIATLQPNRQGLVVEFKLLKIKEVRTVKSRRDGSTHRVADILIGDESGSIILTLWDDEIEKVEEGKVFRLTGGKTTLFQGRLQLGLNPSGKIESSTTQIPTVDTTNNLSKARRTNPRDRRRSDGKSSDQRSQIRRTKGFYWTRIKRKSEE